MLRKILLSFTMVLLGYSFMFAQTGSVKGKVLDGSGEPLIGANVFIKGTTTGTITDIDGNYIVSSVPVGQQTIVASFIGYSNVELPATINEGQETVLDFTMQEDITALDELVVIGYGTVKKDDATGSVSTVSVDDFNQGNITSPQDLIVGKTAGVVITNNGGAPGSGSTIRIRGGSSLSASNDPLIIVDGVPISNENMGGSSNILSFINPNDIETFTVLKDASATAIYGSRASNGVIIITTKKGKTGKPLKVSYNGSMSVAQPISFVDVYTGDQFRQIAADNTDLFDENVYDLLGDANTDWQDEIFRSAFSHDHNISLTGSYNWLPYRVSVGFTDQKGILENTDMKRVTGAVSLDPSLLDDMLKVNVNAKIMNTNNNFGETGAIGSAVAMDPTQTVRNDTASQFDGYFQWPSFGANLGTANPVEQAMAADNKSNVFRFVGNVQLDYTMPFLPDLKANLNVAKDYTDGTGHNNRPLTSTTNVRSIDSRLTDYNNTYTNDLLDFYLSYNKDLGGIHNINAMGGYSWQHFQREGDNYARSYGDSIVQDSSYFITENYLVSFFGRANYSLMNKYLLTGTVRYDGSSRFAEGNQWGLFPSAAFAWKINKEAFLENVTVLSDLKLRLGWGITGQQAISDNNYPAQTLYVVARPGSYYPIDGEFLPTLRPNSYDPNIKWEETVTQNIGFDYGFLEDRITGTIDIYKRVTNDLINTVTVPSGSNFSNRVTTNIGSLENKGVEFAITGVAISKPDMSLDISYNFTYNKNEITKLLQSDDPSYLGNLHGNAFTGQNQVDRVGEAARSFFVNKQVYDQNGKPIEGLYEDLTGEGGIVANDNNDKYVFHNPAPDYTMGFSVRFAYKNFDISSSARANVGNYVFNMVAAGSSYDQMQQIGYWRNMPTYLDETNFRVRQFPSDYFVSNASFLKVDNISAGYNFDQLGDNLNLRVNFTIQNVLTITKYEGLDPEVNDGTNPGIDNNFYPRPRTYTLGLSLNF